MSDSGVIDIQTVETLLQNNHMLLADLLKNVFKLERDQTGAPIPLVFSKETINVLLTIMKELQVQQQNENENTKNLTRELFRSLRNYAVNPEVRNNLINNKDFLNDMNSIMSNLQLTQRYDILQLVLQFLINMVISSKDAAGRFFDLYLEKIFYFLREKLFIYETSALLYNISLYKPLNNFNIDKYTLILELYESDDHMEFLQFLLETFMKYEHFWNLYKNFTIRQRLVTLKFIRCKQIDGEKLNLAHKGITTLSEQFVKSGNIIFQTVANTESNLEPYEVAQLLEVISSLCSDERYLKILQNDKDLLINCGVLLINIHNLGRESENCFSSIQKLSEIRQPTEEIEQHPAFGFKVGLIRIIGNLCWNSETMQNLVREAELIPVILDCCNMDARNPLIIQWSILAIRNLCKNNPKNQEIIAGMHQQGTVSSTTLEKMGLTLHSDGNNSLKIVSLEALKNTK